MNKLSSIKNGSLKLPSQKELSDLLRQLSVSHKKENCNVCGYSSCEEMALAVFNDADVKENCICYLKNAVEKISYIDSLCDIPNYQGFLRLSKDFIKTHEGKRLTAVYFDINDFKLVNENCGYKEGDNVLQFISVSLNTIFDENSIISRLAADNFILLLADITDEEILNKLNILECTILQYYCKCTIEFSFGIYSEIVGNDPSVIHHFLDCANFARKTIKTSLNKHYAIYDLKMDIIKHDEKKLLDELKMAIKRNEFEVFYQPKFNLKTGEISGCESLIRWNHPEKGIISPTVFIPLAEEMHLIVDIDRFVFKTVCSDISEWNKTCSFDKPVSINVSRAEFYQSDFIDFIDSTVQKYNVPIKQLEIEITETVAVKDFGYISTLLKELKNKGFSISIDDFGSGYSSLGCLEKLPIDILKLDRSLLLSMQDDKRGKIILESIILLAKQLNFETICEGIETSEQWKSLLDLKCDYGQGFIYAKPMTKTNFLRFLQEKKL